MDNNSKTYVAGSIEDLAACKKLMLYRSDNFSKISLNNIKKIVDSLEMSKSFAILERSNISELFTYSKTDQSNNIRYTGFNVIIYLNYLDIPVGYTEFNTVQGLIPNEVNININFSTSENLPEETDNVTILNSLSDNIKEYISLTNKLISDDLFGYTTKEKLIQYLQNNNNACNKYTNSISDIIRDDKKIIYTNNGILSSEGFRKLQLITEMTIAEGFDHYQLGYFNGEIVLYSWKYVSEEIVSRNTNRDYVEITVTSMSRKDKFGNYINYIKEGTKQLENVQIRYFSGKYASIIDGAGNKCCINILPETDDIFTYVVADKNSNHIIDLWGIRSQVIELPKPINRRNLIECIPEVLSLKIDIKNYRQTINLEKKIGEWYVFKEKRSNLSNLGNSNTLNFYIYTNLTKTVTISADYDEEPIVVNNNILMLRTKTKFDGKNYDYYTYFLGERDYYSENALLAMDLVMGAESIGDNKRINETTKSIIYSDTNSSYYESKELVVDHVGSDILESYCFDLRRCKCPDDYKVPEFIGAINGLLYYKNKDKIKLL